MARVSIGSLAELQSRGCLTGKVGTQPVCVFWHEDRAYAVDDRCPHMGFPLHRGTVESGLLTCHWHHARFDLRSGGTLDPWADDVRAYPVEIEDGTVSVVVDGRGADLGRLEQRLEEGLEQGLTLVLAKAVLALLEAGMPVEDVVRLGVRFGVRNRAAGWGAGLTVLTAMANVASRLDPADRALALVHGLAFVSRDTRGRPPRFPLAPLASDVPAGRLSDWYRRFVDTRSADPAERTLATAVAARLPAEELVRLMSAAATDHVFLDGGHVVDFTNKAFEVLDHIGSDAAGDVLPTLVEQTARASRAEEQGPWRHPHDLPRLLAAAWDSLPEELPDTPGMSDDEIAALGRDLLDEDPEQVLRRLVDALVAGAGPEAVARAVAFAAALRITRFHTQNDHGDWDVVHHAFTAANAVHQLVRRAPSRLLLRGVFHGALRVFLDRFLNVPAARLPTGEVTGDLDDLQSCWDAEGGVDRAGALVYRYVREGGDQDRLVAELGRALLAEDAQFHWYQTFEAAVRHVASWPAGSEPAALVLAGTARFLAAHTPTRRELRQVVRIATRLRRGEALFEEA